MFAFGHITGSAKQREHPPTIAVPMIARNAEKTIGRAIASVLPFVRRIYILDTGSTDKTLSILEKLTDEWNEPGNEAIIVEQTEWEDSFAAAQNQAAALVPDDYQWIMWLHADDVLVRGGEILTRIVATATPDVEAFLCRYDYYAADLKRLSPLYRHADTWRPLLLRRSAGPWWEGRAHEQIHTTSVGGNAWRLKEDAVRLRHLGGSARRLLSLDRLEYARQLLLRDLEENVRPTMTRALLAWNALDRDEEAEGLKWAREVLALPNERGDAEARDLANRIVFYSAERCRAARAARSQAPAAKTAHKRAAR